MQEAFASRLCRMRWNNCDGFERVERWRYMVQDVLTLAQGFVDVVLHPLVKNVAQAYIGPGYTLCEAKGWHRGCFYRRTDAAAVSVAAYLNEHAGGGQKAANAENMAAVQHDL